MSCYSLLNLGRAARARVGRAFGAWLLLILLVYPIVASAQIEEIVITNDVTLARGVQLTARLVIRASHVTIDGNGATLIGPGKPNDLRSFETAGAGIFIEGCADVTIKNIRIRGFASGLAATDCKAIRVVDCDFSDNYHNPAHGWGELPVRGGIILRQVHNSVFQRAKANRVWNGVCLIESHDNLVIDSDFSECSNVCAKLWNSCRNKFISNNLSYGLRIDRAAGEVHARDSAGLLVESGSDDNYFFGNDITHGGDGIFVRVLNGWVSRGNVFIENDTSYANNNCIESWSPGNTYIRNKANHGSYGFWLGGSDQTVLIGNEAAFNGAPDGFHNAPEPGFGHGGIVIVGGPSSHTTIEGNFCHHNNGAGIVFRGDTASKGKRWQTYHWIVQQNRVENNRWGIWGKWGDWIYLANNAYSNNIEGNYFSDVTRLVEGQNDFSVKLAPTAMLTGPNRVIAGKPVSFDASASRDPHGRQLSFFWDAGGAVGKLPVLTHTFADPGFYRVGLTVDNGVLASLAYRDLLVLDNIESELGTEDQAGQWGFEMEGNADGKGKVSFSNEPDALFGRASLRFVPDPYPGAYVTAIFPASRNADLNLAGKTQLTFWMRAQNPNLPGFQNPGPVIRLYSAEGVTTYTPAADGNLLVNLPFSEARWNWMRVVVPLKGSGEWVCETDGKPNLEHINSMSISLDSWGGEPFTIWIDGLAFE